MGTPECAPHAPRGGDGAGRMTGGGGATNAGTPRRFAPAPHSLPGFPLGWPRRWRLAFGGRSRARAGPRKRAHATCFRRSGRTAQRCPGVDKGTSGRAVRPARRPPVRPKAAGAVPRRPAAGHVVHPQRGRRDHRRRNGEQDRVEDRVVQRGRILANDGRYGLPAEETAAQANLVPAAVLQLFVPGAWRGGMIGETFPA